MNEKVIVLPKEPISVEQSRVRLRQLSILLDSAIIIPGTSIQIGVDSIVGIIPGLGDAISALFSSYIIFEGAKLGLPFHALVRMLIVVGIDTLIGAIPILGDLFDVAFKANLKNVALIERYIDRGNLHPRSNESAARAIQLVILLSLITMFTLIVLLVRWVIKALWH